MMRFLLSDLTTAWKWRLEVVRVLASVCCSATLLRALVTCRGPLLVLYLMTCLWLSIYI